VALTVRSAKDGMTIGWASEKYLKPGSVGHHLRNHNALNFGTFLKLVPTTNCF
jgi:hypothetical protein